MKHEPFINVFLTAYIMEHQEGNWYSKNPGDYKQEVMKTKMMCIHIRAESIQIKKSNSILALFT